jgi:hypothetical protein
MGRRRRSLVTPGAWVWLVVIAGLHLAAVATLGDLARVMAVALPAVTAFAVPPALYLVIALLLGRRAPARALGGALAMAAAHAALAAAGVAVLLGVDGRAVTVALSLVTTPVGVAVQAATVLVMLAPFRGLLRPPVRYPRTTARADRPVYPRAKAPVATPPPEEIAASPAITPDGAGAPADAGGPALAEDAVAAVVDGAAAAPVVDEPTAAPVEPPPVDAGRRSPVAEPVEEMVRVPFARVADQFPPEAFRLPMDRVAANLLEPGHLLVPIRLLLPQLAEGVAQVAWSVVAEQFPGQALAGAHAEVARLLPAGMLTLPIDEIVPQLPAVLFTPPGTALDVRGLEDFPPPFQPHVPPPGEEDEDTRAAETEATSADDEPDEEAVIVVGADEECQVETANEDPSSPVVEPERIGEHELDVVAAAPAMPAAAVEPPAVDADARPAPAAVALPEALARSLHVSRVTREGVGMTMAVAPALDADVVADTALRMAPFLADRRLGTRAEQVTYRNGPVAVVVTPRAPGALVVAASDTAASLALLERWALQAAGGGAPSSAVPSPALARGERLRSVDVPGAVSAVAGTLRSFGPVAPTVMHDETTGTVLYLFLPPSSPALPMATFARDVTAELATGELGVPVSVTFRLGSRRLVIQALESGVARTALLVAGGPVDRPGLARVELERAARRLAGV